ncbi:MAG: hypothetical protein K5924_03885 [Chloroflexi bacterium]|nr:hypothetical protein [Chloroflexota bacterium]
MSRSTLPIFAFVAVALLATGMSPAPTAAAGNGPVIVVDPIRDHNVHEEWDGTITESWVTGTRRTATFADGRTSVHEEMSIHQRTSREGVLILESWSQTESRYVLEGEHTRFYSFRSHADTLQGDGTECVIDSRMLVVDDRTIIADFGAPVCS